MWGGVGGGGGGGAGGANRVTQPEGQLPALICLFRAEWFRFLKSRALTREHIYPPSGPCRVFFSPRLIEHTPVLTEQMLISLKKRRRKKERKEKRKERTSEEECGAAVDNSSERRLCLWAVRAKVQVQRLMAPRSN